MSQLGRGDDLNNVTDSLPGKAKTILRFSDLGPSLFNPLSLETLWDLSAILVEGRKRWQGLGRSVSEPRHTLKDYDFSYKLVCLSF